LPVVWRCVGCRRIAEPLLVLAVDGKRIAAGLGAHDLHGQVRVAGEEFAGRPREAVAVCGDADGDAGMAFLAAGTEEELPEVPVAALDERREQILVDLLH
jgi:hypothetical protein